MQDAFFTMELSFLIGLPLALNQALQGFRCPRPFQVPPRNSKRRGFITLRVALVENSTELISIPDVNKKLAVVTVF